MKGGLLITIATIGVTFSLQGRFADRGSVDIPLRLMLAALSLVVLLHPSEQVAALTCLPVGSIIGYWLLRRRPAAAASEEPAGAPVLAASFAEPDSTGRAN